MLTSVLFCIAVLLCGFATLRPLGVLKGLTGIGLVAPTGLACMAVLGTWAAALHLPPPVAGTLVALLSLAGAIGAVRDYQALRHATTSFFREHRLASGLLGLGMVVPALTMGVAFYGVQVPLSPHDGAFHVDVTQLMRAGSSWPSWYPPGLPATFAAFLQLLPWLDAAQGAFELGLALTLLAPLITFGLGLVVWRNPLIGSVGALLVSLTYLFPYFAQLWAGWPLLMSMLLTVGLWVATSEYLARPGWRWAVLAGGLLGAVVLVHGTELYTIALILLVLALGNWRRLDWRGLPRHLVLAGVLAAAIAAPYLPTLFGWAAAGGAYAVGFDDGKALVGGATSVLGNSLFAAFLGQSLGIDLPIRVVLLGIGVWWAFRQRSGRVMVAVGGLFLLIAVLFSTLSGLLPVRQLYAITFPWGMHYRILMVVTIAQALLAGAGAVVLCEGAAARFRRWASGASVVAARRARRLGRLLLITWGVLCMWAMVVFVEIPTGLVNGYTGEDAAAMAWLKSNVAPQGAVVANDSFADAGIWAPYKAGVSIVMPRLISDGTDNERSLILTNILRLDQVPDAARAACRLGVGYVYHGAKLSEWDQRRLPSLEEMRASPNLQEAFASGDAVVFRLELNCPRG